MAAGSMKDIKLRIKSVQSTMQITKAMELVASSKLRRAKLRVEQSRPYFTVLNEALVDIASSNTEFMSPYTKNGKSDAAAISSSQATEALRADITATCSSWWMPPSRARTL